MRYEMDTFHPCENNGHANRAKSRDNQDARSSLFISRTCTPSRDQGRVRVCEAHLSNLRDILEITLMLPLDYYPFDTLGKDEGLRAEGH